MWLRAILFNPLSQVKIDIWKGNSPQLVHELNPGQQYHLVCCKIQVRLDRFLAKMNQQEREKEFYMKESRKIFYNF